MLQVGDFKNLEDWTNYLVKLNQEFQTLSAGHIRWYTHKNPYGCWICDVFKLIDKWEDIYYPESPKISMNKVLDTEEDEVVIKSDENIALAEEDA